MNMRKSKTPSVPECDCVDTQNDANRATYWSQRRVEETRYKLAQFELDVDKDDRLLYGQCRWCWYFRSGGIAGQAFTSRRCDTCGETQTYSSTDTLKLCLGCSQKYELCRRCSGDIHERTREELQPPKQKALRQEWWADQERKNEAKYARLRKPTYEED